MTATLHHPRYHFDRWIAGGGMGDVWAATDTLLERPVAVKVLKQQYADDEVFRARFIAEARHAASLQHPNVATVLDYGEIPDAERSPLPFLVMELVDGRPLSALLAGGQALRPEVARDLVAQAADGVAAAHRLGIVHRDVKPANLLVTPEGQVKVTDFGVARALDAAPLTLTGQLVGTPHYLSPEQVQGAAATPASDVYALGIVLYECLTGRRPFVGDTAVATALMHVRDALPPFPDPVPDDLQAITRRATAKDPAERWPSMEAFAAALRDPDPAVVPVPAGAPLPLGEDVVSQAPGDRYSAEPPTAVVPAVRRPDMRKLGIIFGSISAIMIVVGSSWAILTRQNSSAVHSNAPTASSSPRPGKVRVRPAAYIGLPAATAARKLRRLGFQVTTRVRTNNGAGVAGTVAGLGPTGLLAPGSRIVLSAWGPAPANPSPTGTGPAPKHHAPAPAPKPHPPKGHGPGHGPGHGKGGPKPHKHPGKGKHGGKR